MGAAHVLILPHRICHTDSVSWGALDSENTESGVLEICGKIAESKPLNSDLNTESGQRLCQQIFRLLKKLRLCLILWY
ncbi:hypothetical protein [uncultured Helicobacter sp.]|uniref:hypothetical protein n=1 Tax=uncultured Helicobacter sp. TaxID=175537 RepID=UPI00374E9C8D